MNLEYTIEKSTHNDSKLAKKVSKLLTSADFLTVYNTYKLKFTKPPTLLYIATRYNNVKAYINNTLAGMEPEVLKTITKVSCVCII